MRLQLLSFFFLIFFLQIFGKLGFMTKLFPLLSSYSGNSFSFCFCRALKIFSRSFFSLFFPCIFQCFSSAFPVPFQFHTHKNSVILTRVATYFSSFFSSFFFGFFFFFQDILYFLPELTLGRKYRMS